MFLGDKMFILWSKIMKIIFLDIDGVLNTERYIIEQYNQRGKRPPIADYNFDPICLENLKELIKATNAYIVISSSWRIREDEFVQWQLGKYNNDEHWNALIRNLNSIGLNERILDVTPRLSRERGNEIRKWLQNNEQLNIESFVIIDDDRDMCEFTETNLVKCNWKDGLTEELKDEAIKILNGK